MFKKSFVFCLVLFCVLVSTAYSNVYYKPSELKDNEYFVENLQHERIYLDKPFPKEWSGISINDFKQISNGYWKYEKVDPFGRIEISLLLDKNKNINSVCIYSSNFNIAREIKIEDNFLEIFGKLGEPTKQESVRNGNFLFMKLIENNFIEYHISYGFYHLRFDKHGFLKKILFGRS